MVLKKSSLKKQNEFSLPCQECGRIFTITPAELENSDQLCKIFGMKGLYIFQCHCGARCNVQLEFRRNARHPIDSGAFYTTLTRQNSVRRVGSESKIPYKTIINSVVKNISVDGIGFITHGRHNIVPDDELMVNFTLRVGDQERLLARKVVVRTVSANYIGAEFFPEDKKDPVIGFYLMPD